MVKGTGSAVRIRAAGGGGDLPHDLFAGAQHVLLARRRAVHQHEAAGDEALGGGPAQPGVRGEHDVEALAGVALRGAERVRRHSRAANDHLQREEDGARRRWPRRRR